MTDQQRSEAVTSIVICQHCGKRTRFKDTDRQRSEAVTVEAEAILQAMNADTLRELVKQHAQTIAELRREVALLEAAEK